VGCGGILGTLLGDSLIWDANCCTFAVPAGAQCDVLATAMACLSMLRSGRPIPGLPRSSLPGAHFCVEIPRPVATELAPPGGCIGPLAADLSNRTRRAVGAKDARTTRTPPGLRRGQVRTALTVGVADGEAGGPRRSQTAGGTAGLSVPGHAGRRAAPRNADCNSQMTADCNSSGMRTVIRSERITVTGQSSTL
jgi:hypothetical protein